MRASIPAVLLLASLLLPAGPAVPAGQGPDASWRTIETRSYRVHYPAAWEPWAEHVASRLEPIRDVVADAVGYRPESKVDVVLADPVGRPNAMALPLLGSPRMVLWATPPGASSAIGAYDDWTELLVLHEDVHLVHLLRPSRSPWRRLASWTVDVGPLSTEAPRWLTEGYATLLEGRLTGSGRPNADFRAAVLRARARVGKLPTYGDLGAAGEGWQDSSMAYLAGSAFLEWLEAAHGPDALPNLWRRMSAREERTFDEAFEGVFAESPRDAYLRFAAETVWRATEVERAFDGLAVEGSTWVEVDGATGAPAMAPDGTSFAVVVREPDRPPELVVYGAAPDEDAMAEREDRIEEMLLRDPEDVAPVAPRVAPRERRRVLPTYDGAPPEAPRFLPSGDEILFHRFVPDAEGVLRPDLFLWDLARDDVRRVTNRADVRDADPAPSGEWAAAVRMRGGACSIVRVDLESGAVTTLVPGAVPDVFDHPRVAPDGSRLVYLRHRDGRWRVVIRSIDTGREREVELPGGVSVAEPAWHPDGRRLWLVVGRDGFLDVAVVDPEEPGALPVLRSRSIDGVVAPEPVPGTDEALVLGLGADGREVRRVPAGDAIAWADAPRLDASLAPTVRPRPPEAPPRGGATEDDGDVPEPRTYGAGRPEVRGIAVWNVAPSANQFVAGARVGDVIGRFEALGGVAFGSRRSARGGFAAGVWRGLPVEVRARATYAEERPSAQSLADPVTGTALDADRLGLEVAADWHRSVGAAARVSATGGLSYARIEPVDSGALDREVAFVEAAARWRPSRGDLWLRLRGSGRFDAGRTDGDGWTRVAAQGGFALGRRSVGLAVDAEVRDVSGTPSTFDLVALGGTDGAILTSTDVAARVVVPALPAGTRIGDRYVGGRVGLEMGERGPWVAFWETHRVRPAGAPRDESIDLAGVEWIFAIDRQPLLRVPSASVRVGAAYVLDDPTGGLDGRTRGWVMFSIRP